MYYWLKSYYTEPCARGVHELLWSKLAIDCTLIWLKPIARRRRSFTSGKQLWSTLMIDWELILLEPCARKAREKRRGSWTTMDASFWFMIDCELTFLKICARLQNSCQAHRQCWSKLMIDWTHLVHSLVIGHEARERLWIKPIIDCETLFIWAVCTATELMLRSS